MNDLETVKDFMTPIEESTIKKKSLLQTVIENSYDGLVMINGNITFVSPF
jgi:hypothetical protein